MRNDVKTHGSSLIAILDSRRYETRSIRPLESSKGHAWLSFKREVEQDVLIDGFGESLFRNPPICIDSLNEQELLRLGGMGVSPDDVKRARFAYLLIINSVRDSRSAHSCRVKISVHSMACFGSIVPSKNSGEKMDAETELKYLKYSKGQDTDEFSVQIQSVQSCARSLGLEISGDIVVDQF